MIEVDGEEHSSEDIHSPNLKTHNGIVLMPQPSDDPLDPLNWYASLPQLKGILASS
jgi:hypothetical protein